MKSSARFAKVLVIALGLTGAVAFTAPGPLLSGHVAPPVVGRAGKSRPVSLTPGEDRRCAGCHNPQPCPMDPNGPWQMVARSR